MHNVSLHSCSAVPDDKLVDMSEHLILLVFSEHDFLRSLTYFSCAFIRICEDFHLLVVLGVLPELLCRIKID